MTVLPEEAEAGWKSALAITCPDTLPVSRAESGPSFTDRFAAFRWFQATAEGGSGLRVEAGRQAYTHAGAQGDGLAGGDDASDVAHCVV